MPGQFRVDLGALVPDGPRQDISPPFSPDAVIYWWAPSGAKGVKPNAGGIGFAASGFSGACVGWCSADGTEMSQTSSWYADRPAVARLGTAESEIDGSLELGASGVALTWRRWSPDWTLHYLALGGVEARADWVQATAGEPVSVRVGFRPDLVLFIPSPNARPSVPSPGLIAGFGAVSARAQAACSYVSPHAMKPGSVRGAQRSGVAVVVPTLGDGPVATAVAGLADGGFSLAWRDVPDAGLGCAFLALRGMSASVGVTVSPRRPGVVRTGGMGFRPQALVSATWGLAPSLHSKPIGRLSLGVTTGSATGSAAWDDRNIDAEVTATHTHCSRERVVQVADSQTGGLHAAASLRHFHRDGFAMHWPLSDRAREVLYVAMAPSPGNAPGPDAPAGAGGLNLVGRALRRVPAAVRRRS